jgi:hypothetical protein
MKKKAQRKAAEKVTWMIVGAGASMLASSMVRRSMAAGWRAITDDDPPSKPESPKTGLKGALAWTAASAVAVGLSQILAKRGAAMGWQAYSGKLPPL